MASFIKGLELDKEDPTGKLIAVQENPGIDGTFCLSCLMWQSLSDPNNALLLVSTHHPFNFYYHVGMKLGYNLNSQSKRAVFHNLQEKLSGLSFSNTNYDLKNVFSDIKTSFDTLRTEYKQVTIILDNLSSFLFVGFPPSEVKLLIHYLKTLTSDGLSSVVALVQVSPEDEDENDINTFLRQTADWRFTVSPLKTGSAHDVSGSIELSKRNPSKIKSWTNSGLYHYKLSERNVKIFHPGNI